MSQETSSTSVAPPQQTAVALARTPRDIKSLIQSKEFEMAVSAGLPKHLKVDRFMRVALNATLRQPELLECNRESLFLRMLELSALGIEPDGRRAHLIPFFNNKVCVCGHSKDQHQQGKCRVGNCACSKLTSRREVQLIIDYKGIAELVRRSGDVSYMHCDAVYSNDEWEFAYGSEAVLKHKPTFGEDRGRLLGFYSFVKLRDGNEDFIVMSKAEVDKIRKRSKSSDFGPWVSDYEEMGKKTVFRRHSKWLPLSPETKDAVEGDDESDTFDAAGAITLANEVVDDRLRQQMEEQAEEAQREAGGGEPSQTSKAAESDKPATEENKPATATITGRWPNRDAMLADFEVPYTAVGEPAFFTALGNNGINSADELQIGSPETLKAYEELDAIANPKEAKKVMDAKPEPANGPRAVKPQFGKKNQ